MNQNLGTSEMRKRRVKSSFQHHPFFDNFLSQNCLALRLWLKRYEQKFESLPAVDDGDSLGSAPVRFSR